MLVRFLRAVFHHLSANKKVLGGDQWECLGNKVRSRREQSGGSWFLSHCRSGFCTSSHCGGTCACASAELGSPTVRMCSCSLNPVDIRWPTSRRLTSR